MKTQVPLLTVTYSVSSPAAAGLTTFPESSDKRPVTAIMSSDDSNDSPFDGNQIKV
jgi:hypothetical protein